MQRINRRGAAFEWEYYIVSYSECMRIGSYEERWLIYSGAFLSDD